MGVVTEILLTFIVLFLVPLAIFVWSWKPFPVPKTLPGPQRFPLIGLLWFAIKNWSNWPKVCCATSKEYNHSTWGGPCFRYGAIFYTDNPVNVRHLLKDNFQNYEKGKVWRSFFREILGNGIFNADGELWASHRKISAKLFSRNLLKYSCKVVDRNCRLIIRQFEEAIDVAGEMETTVDLQDLFHRLTIDSTAENTFGFQMGSLKAKKQPFFAAAFDELQELCLARVVDPFFEIKRTLQLTVNERRIRYLQKKLRAFCEKVIREKQLAIQRNDSDHEDLLSLFLKYGEHDNKAKESQELTDVILNFMVAGRDTTAAALSWTFFELSTRPDVVQKIVSEAAEVFGPHETADYSFEGLNKLRYTHCVVMEALRLHPPVPVDSKFAIHSDTLPDGTHIPARSLITYLPYSMGRNEDIYGSDMVAFKPERFMNEKEPSPFSFSVFNAGPRLCLGKPLALLTMKMVLVQLLPRFDFRDDIGHTDAMKWSLVGKMKDGFTVQVYQRKTDEH